MRNSLLVAVVALAGLLAIVAVAQFAELRIDAEESAGKHNTHLTQVFPRQPNLVRPRPSSARAPLAACS